MTKLVVDLDDFYDETDALDKLVAIKEKYPNFKITLFTIPGKISLPLLKKAKKLGFIQMAVHGYDHHDNYEFSKPTEEEAMKLLFKRGNLSYYVKGFKAPGWQISVGAMKALSRMNFWVAVQYPDDRMNGHPDGPYQPAVIDGLPYYSHNMPPEGYIGIHGHIWDCCGNGIDVIIKEIEKYPTDIEFEYIDNLFK